MSARRENRAVCYGVESEFIFVVKRCRLEMLVMY